jgi:hypothetical protein
MILILLLRQFSRDTDERERRGYLDDQPQKDVAVRIAAEA